MVWCIQLQFTMKINQNCKVNMPGNHGSYGNSSRQIQCRFFRNTPKGHFLPNSSGVATGRFRPRRCCWGEAGWKIDAVKVPWFIFYEVQRFVLFHSWWDILFILVVVVVVVFWFFQILPPNQNQRQETPSRTQRIFLGITTASLRQLRAGSVWSPGWSLGVQGYVF